ncbi:MAG: phosphonate C-P lyase system protein PhnL [Rhodospirillales bacterium]|jgi:alpha-D-ribose 1-methylphosphonate 5-triphosphate synthase subunit PhnL
MTASIRLVEVSKSFTLHNQGGAVLPVLDSVSLEIGPRECVALVGPSGIGKSTILRIAYGNYAPDSGRVIVASGGRAVDIARASPRQILALRRDTLGHVSQFLRVIPRVPALDVVADAARAAGAAPEEARDRASAMLTRLGIPKRLWGLSPTTFSGGEQQRVNIARVFVVAFPVLLLDEPTASLDDANKAIVLRLIDEARAGGAAILGIFHDPAAREAVATRELDCRIIQKAAA